MNEKHILLPCSVWCGSVKIKNHNCLRFRSYNNKLCDSITKYHLERGDIIETCISMHKDCPVSTTIFWKGMPSQQQEGTNISWKSLDATQACISISSPSELLTARTHCLLMSLRLLPCRLSKTGWIPSGQHWSFSTDGLFFFFFLLPTHAVTSEFES